MTALRPGAVSLTGCHLIEASAGTGKTYTITTLVLRLLLERRLRLDQILVVTFTKAAAAELRERVRRRLQVAAAEFATRGTSGDDRDVASLVAGSEDRERDHAHLLEALRGLDEAPIHTIHAFCARVLGEHAFESGAPFGLENTGEDRVIVADLVAAFWARETARASPEELLRLRQRAPFAKLVELAARAAAQPDLELVPRLAEVATEALVSAWTASRGRARAVWRAERESIVALLCTHPSLDRRRYRVAWIHAWATQVDALLRGGIDVPSEHLEAAARLTPEALARGCKAGQAPPRHPCFEALASALEARAAAADALDAWVVALEQRLCVVARSELLAARRRLGLVTFDDLLLELRAALRGPDGERLARQLRDRYPAALIDEFQDTDPVQYEILRRIYGAPGVALYLIGDPKQAIYSFRGADVFAYLRAAGDAESDPLTLTTSYRSDPRLVAAINRWFGWVGSPFLFDAIRYQAVSPRPGASERLETPEPGHSALELVWVGPEGTSDGAGRGRVGTPQLLAGAAAEVSRWLRAGATIDGAPLRASDLAVLTRSNHEAEVVQAALAELGIRAVVYGDRSVLETPEAAELGLVLAALAAPARGASVRAALATPLLGLDGLELAALRADEPAWEAWLARFARWHERWRTRGFAVAFRGLLGELAVIPRLLGETRGERRLTNLMHLAELLQGAAAEHHLGPLGLQRWFDRVRSDAAARAPIAAEATQVRLEGDGDAVRVVTMHRSKGLEYPVVICASLAARASPVGGRHQPLLFHDPAQGGRALLHLGGEGHAAAQAQAAREALAESLRLAYVGLTRARHQATVLTGAVSGLSGSPLHFALHGGEAAERGLSEVEPAARPSPAALHADLVRFAGEDPRIVGVRAVSPAVALPASPGSDRFEVSSPRAPNRRFSRVRRVTSYTGLVAGGGRMAAGGGGAESEPEGPDHDELMPAAPLAGTPMSGVTAELEMELAVALEGSVPLGELPRGAAAGNALHALLERLDFPSYDPVVAQPVVNAELLRHGLDAAKWGEQVAAALGGVIDTPLTEGGLRLRDLVPGRWRCELEFTLPVRPGGAGTAHPCAPLDPGGLARVFAACGGPQLPADYPERIAELDFAGLSGHLRGFIDLVFEHEGRYYVVDYKSNHLGARAGDYLPRRLAVAMAEHHYHLQAHLYVVALHRHLASRLAGYDYERHFGGVLYLFLRGLVPALGGRTGVFADRPRRGLVDELSRTLAEVGAE